MTFGLASTTDAFSPKKNLCNALFPIVFKIVSQNRFTHPTMNSLTFAFSLRQFIYHTPSLSLGMVSIIVFHVVFDKFLIE